MVRGCDLDVVVQQIVTIHTGVIQDLMLGHDPADLLGLAIIAFLADQDGHFLVVVQLADVRDYLDPICSNLSAVFGFFFYFKNFISVFTSIHRLVPIGLN